MPTDRSDEIRVLVLKQRIDKFMKFVEEPIPPATLIRDRAVSIFGGKEDDEIKLDD